MHSTSPLSPAIKFWAQALVLDPPYLKCPKKMGSSLIHMCHPYAGAMLIFSVFFQFRHVPHPKVGNRFLGNWVYIPFQPELKLLSKLRSKSSPDLNKGWMGHGSNLVGGGRLEIGQIRTISVQSHGWKNVRNGMEDAKVLTLGTWFSENSMLRRVETDLCQMTQWFRKYKEYLCETYRQLVKEYIQTQNEVWIVK